MGLGPNANGSLSLLVIGPFAKLITRQIAEGARKQGVWKIKRGQADVYLNV